MSRESALSLATGNPVSVPSTVSSTTQSTTAAEGAPSLENAASSAAEPKQQEDVKSKAFTHLAKKEAEIVKQRQELKAEREKLQGAANEYQKYLELKKTDPIGAMKMIGFSETDIFNYMAAQQPQELTPEQKAAQAAEAAAEAKIKAFEDAQAKKQQDIETQQDQAVVQAYRNNVSSVIKGAPDKFEYCSYYGPVAEDLIYETVQTIVKESNGEDVPTPQEAAELVEAYYEEQDKEMSKLKKRQPKEPEAPLKAEVAPKPERTRTVSSPATPKPPSRTLHNGATSTVAATRTQFNESRAEKRERLMDRLKNGG